MAETTDQTRLSLRTVPWIARLVALFFAMLTAMLLYLPAGILDGAIRSGNWRLTDFGSAFFFGAIVSTFLFPSLLLIALMFFGLPAILMNHIALWLRCNFWGFVAAGISAAIIGFVIWSMSAHGFSNVIRETASHTRYWDDWSLAAPIRRSWIAAVVCGGGGAAVAWCVMWASQRRSLENP
jgi:hypothetical protein